MEPKNDRGSGDNNNNKGKNGFNIIIIAVIAVLFVIFFNYMRGSVQESNRVEITYDEFLDMLEKGNVKSVLLTEDGTIEITGVNTITGQTGIVYYTGRITDPDLVSRLEESGVTFKQEISSQSSGIISMLITTVLPFLIFYGLLFFVFRSMTRNGGGLMGIGKSNAKVYAQKDTGVTFRDVAGQDEAKESLKEIVDFLHNPGKYTKIGAKLPKGALLVGPPGTGKTLLARAVAGEANVPFFSLSGSDFVEMYVGVGASRVRDLFKQAQQSAPCIIFIDELDAIGKSRDNRFGSNDEREQTLNQLLSEMDGFDSSKGII
ncbi:MAG: ATP-dependent metallopeptidase FtsH/Yme1/Tma family protein, partial [Lachnospiraceae bacterium]|nr:ATP-dependent metallopeptidase FtsH/Yme1/Tma family protein [Lachnospiraceae bacterium]